MFSGETMNAVMNVAGIATLSRPRRDRILDDILLVWGRKVNETAKRERAELASLRAA
jgi:hypothetical protein